MAPSERHHGRHHHHGNPEDLDRYIERMLAADREGWQKPDEVVAALRLSPGDTVGEVGAGPGFFTLRLARAVGPLGHVYAVDVVPEILAVLRQRLDRAAPGNVTPILAKDDDPLIPAASCDVVLIVNTFHHFPDGVAYLRLLASKLKPGGRIANIDYHRREMPVGPPIEHKVAREDFLASASRAGLSVVDEITWLPHQYFVVMQRR